MSSEATRRDFLKTAAVAGAALAAGTASQAAAAALPRVTIAGQTIPRMIVGCNQIGGWSHMCRNMTLAMTDYFTLDRTIEYLQRCEGLGLDVWLTYWDQKPLTALRTLWERGSKLRTYFLGNLDAQGKLSRDVLEYQPLWYIHHGNVTDTLFRAGKHEKVHDFLKKVHDELGLPAGISAHNPDCIKYAEDHGWEADLYQCCLYQVTRPHAEVRAKLGAAPLGEIFLDTDREAMLQVIGQVKKPCLAFKILAAGRLCDSDDSVEEAFEYAFSRIKPSDAVIVGMWPKFKDEVAQNLAFLRKYGQVR
ncbi:MAG: twin-arginine translocation signal domain-containing protein [Fimbriimonadaceae bacterium]|nr:twin-arginine translocation signal domain-containing protein [Fimbriimonadaceae bacterium]